VKAAALLGAPPAVVTTTSPLLAIAGTVTVILLSDHPGPESGAVIPLKVTVPAFAPK
jgi:hypothetical protein